jgi:hypothetical protein
MKTKTGAAKGARKKSAGRKAPAKKATTRKSTAKKATTKKSTAKKPGKKKKSGEKAAGGKSAIRKATTSSVEDSAPKQEAMGGTNGAPAARQTKPGALVTKSSQAHPGSAKPAANWGDLMHRVIDIVDPSGHHQKPKRPRALDERPVGRWVAASFLAGSLFGWVLAAVL